MALTDKEIRALGPRSRRYRVSDGGGLLLEVDPAGRKYWTTLNANGMGLRFSRQNYRFAGLRLRQALDGGADRRRCLPPCPRQGLGGGG